MAQQNLLKFSIDLEYLVEQFTGYRLSLFLILLRQSVTANWVLKQNYVTETTHLAELIPSTVSMIFCLQDFIGYIFFNSLNAKV